MRLSKNVFFLDKSPRATNEQKEWCLSAAKFMTNAKAFDMFNRLFIILVDSKGGDSESTIGWISRAEASVGKYHIYLVTPLATSKMQAVQSLRHEKVHLLEYVYNSPDIHQDLKEIYKSMNLLKGYRNRLRLIRSKISFAKCVLTDFTKRIKHEGLADYAIKPHALGMNTAVLKKDAEKPAVFCKTIPYHISILSKLLKITINSRKTFKKEVSKILSKSKQRGKLDQDQMIYLKQVLDETIKPVGDTIEEVCENLQELNKAGAAYLLGEHMSYVILWRFRNMRLQDLIKIDYINFLKLYSKACRSLKIMPVFTYEDYEQYTKILTGLDEELIRWEEMCHSFGAQLSWFSRLRLRV